MTQGVCYYIVVGNSPSDCPICKLEGVAMREFMKPEIIGARKVSVNEASRRAASIYYGFVRYHSGVAIGDRAGRENVKLKPIDLIYRSLSPFLPSLC